MSELPKFVAQRLAAAGAAGEHPSADLLAAFAEQNLTGSERQRLMVHLAACHQCREVVWSALPESEAIQPVVAGSAARGWSWFQIWRWAGVAAGVAVIAGVALLFRGGPGPAAEKVAYAPKAPIVAEKRDTLATEAKEASAQRRSQVKESPAKTAPARRERASGNKIAFYDKQAASRTSAQAELDTKDVAPKPSEAKVLAKSADEVSSGAASRVSAAPAANIAPATPAPPAATAEAGVVIASNSAINSMGKKKMAPPTRWMLSPEGALLRSTDAGKNWQAVPFEGAIVFRTMAVIGPRVWVGGQGGVLYYSADDGGQWQRLWPAADGSVLTDDITALAFQDAQHGSLTTRRGQSWITVDGGRTWQKQ